MVCALFLSSSIEWDHCLVQSLTTDSCFVDLPYVTLVYSKIVEVFVDVEVGVWKALLIAE